MLWHPDPPQGFTREQGQIIIGRPIIPLIGAPQGVGGVPIALDDSIQALYPPLGDLDYNNYKFYQVNKDQFPTPQIDFIFEISDTVGPGILQQASGFDFRVFLKNERDLTQMIATGNTFDPQFTLNVIQLSDDELHLFGWQLNGPIHEWLLSAPHVFPPDGTLSNFQFLAPEENGRDIKFIKNGTEMVIVGINNDTVERYSLPTPNSFSTPPVLLQIFNTSFTISDPASCEFSFDGMKLYITNVPIDMLSQWNLSAPFVLPDPLTPQDRTFPYNPPIVASIGNTRMFKDRSAFYMVSANPDQINKYLTNDGPNQIPIVNVSPDAISPMLPDNNSRAISLSVDQSLIWFSGRGNSILTEFFVPGVELEYEVISFNVSTGDFTIKVKVPIIEDFTFIQIAMGNPSATDNSTPLGAATSLSRFETPLFTKDEDIFLVDDQGRNIVAVQ